MDPFRSQEAGFLAFVRLNKGMGYGRMLQLISHEWYRDAKRRGDPVSGVLVCNGCLYELPQDEQDQFVRMAEGRDGE